MNRQFVIFVVVFASLLVSGRVLTATPLWPGFTYQGQLQENDIPVEGPANLRFSLWDAEEDGNQIGESQLVADIPVSNGLFVVTLNESNQFGANAFNGDARWLQLEDCSDGACAAPEVFLPRQPLTGVPYAHNAVSAPWSGLTGIPDGFADNVDNSGDSLWENYGSNISYNAGNVGIGTATPHHQLGISGGPPWTLDEWTGSMELDEAAAIGWHGISGSQRFGIGYSFGGLHFFHTDGDPGTATSEAHYAMTITDAGSVGIGTTIPETRFQVNDSRIRLRETATLERWDLFYDPPSEKFYLQENAAYNHLVFTKGPDSSVGIGSDSPPSNTKLNVFYNKSGYAIRGEAPMGTGVVGTSAASGNAAVAGFHSGLNGMGLQGEADGSSASGVFGRTGSGFGVYGIAGSGYGVYGKSTGGIGVKGESASNYGVEGTSAESWGVSGYSANSIGVSGTSGQGTGVDGFGKPGVRASSNDPGYYALEVRGLNGGVAADFLGYTQIRGDLSVVGDITKSADSIRIDHPLDPSNKSLSHSSVESSDRMNIYNGNVVTDASGYAIVALPDWFEALNKDFRYQLTVIGQFAQAIVEKKIQDNRFTIRTDKPNVEVSWLVTGIRQDPYAKAHPMEVEKVKLEKDRGKYLTPEVYGQPKEMGIHYRPESKLSSGTVSKVE